MKNIKYLILLFLGFSLLLSCSDDNDDGSMSPGNPAIEVKSQFVGAHFGDNLPFTVGVSDNVPLSTLTARLYFGEEKVFETVIRTKTEGDYSGVISIPFYKDIPDGVATLEFVLIDTHLSSVTRTVDLSISRAVYPYLILVTADKSYAMLPTGNAHEYAATEAFPSVEVPAYIKTPAVDDNGTEIIFGWEAGVVTHGVTTEIPFTSPSPGTFSVVFNTRTYEAAPFFEINVNGKQMGMIEKDIYSADIDLTQGQEVTFEGIIDIADYWIDSDFLTKVEDNKFTFAAAAGKYRIIANMIMKYFRIEAMSGNSLATLQADGTGAIWVIGTNFGKPSVADNEVGWNTDKAVCMAPIGDKKYRLTLVAGETVNADAINFKFFHQKGWGGEFGGGTISTSSDIITIGANDGNLSITEDKALEPGATYVFVVDVSAGNENAILTVTKK